MLGSGTAGDRTSVLAASQLHFMVNVLGWTSIKLCVLTRYCTDYDQLHSHHALLC